MFSIFGNPSLKFSFLLFSMAFWKAKLKLSALYGFEIHVMHVYELLQEECFLGSLNLSITTAAEISHSTTITGVVELSYCSLLLNQLESRDFLTMILVNMKKENIELKFFLSRNPI